MLMVLGGIVALILLLLALSMLLALATIVAVIALSAAGAAAVGIVSGLLAGALGASEGLATAVGMAAGLISFPLFVRAAFRQLEGREAPQQPAITRLASTTSPPPPCPEPKNAEAVGAAWVVAAEIAPDCAGRIQRHREVCAELLHLAEADGFDPALRDGAVLIRKHVPELVTRTKGLLRGADTEKGSQLRRDLIVSLEAIGAKAATLVEISRQNQQEALAIHHLHVRHDPEADI